MVRFFVPGPSRCPLGWFLQSWATWRKKWYFYSRARDWRRSLHVGRDSWCFSCSPNNMASSSSRYTYRQMRHRQEWCQENEVYYGVFQHIFRNLWLSCWEFSLLLKFTIDVLSSIWKNRRCKLCQLKSPFPSIKGTLKWMATSEF